MKRRITYVILSILLIGSLVLCVGCGGKTESESGEASAIEALPEKGGDLQESLKPAGNEMAGDEKSAGAEKDDLTLREELRPAVLQIFCGDYRGSGVVWEITDREVTVVSSGHLLKNGDTCEVLCSAGIYYEAKVERILEDCDVGFAVFPADAPEQDGVELTAVTPSERMAAELVRGEELVVYGSMDLVAGDFVKGYLIEAESGLQIEGYDSAQPLLLGGIVRDAGQGEADSGSNDRGAVDSGMSGSGVFDRQGKLLGILAGGDGESGFAAVPVWKIVE